MKTLILKYQDIFECTNDLSRITKVIKHIEGAGRLIERREEKVGKIVRQIEEDGIK